MRTMTKNELIVQLEANSTARVFLKGAMLTLAACSFVNLEFVYPLDLVLAPQMSCLRGIIRHNSHQIMLHARQVSVLIQSIGL